MYKNVYFGKNNIKILSYIYISCLLPMNIFEGVTNIVIIIIVSNVSIEVLKKFTSDI